MRKVIGITGGIASGKSTVSRYLMSLGYQVVDCDLLTREAYVDCFLELQEAFPSCIEHQSINRQKLGAMIFNDEEQKKKLEAIIHPYCRKKMKEAICKNQGILFLDIPLLFEAHMEDLCEEIWVVYVSSKTQLKRLIERNHYELLEAKRRIASQMSLEEKKTKADFVIYNEGSLEDLYKQIQNRLEGYDE